MLSRLLVALILTGSLVSLNANADNGIKYNYGELRYVDVDGGDGIEIGGSYLVDQQIYAFASLVDLDFGAVDSEVIEFGGGFIMPHKKIDFAAELALLTGDVLGDSETGFSLSAGGRTYLTPEIEARAFARHVDIGESDTFIELGGDFLVNTQLSLGVTLEVASDSDALSLGARYHF